MDYKTPGVYVEEIPVFPPSVAQVETAIPAFIGYTSNTTFKGEDLVNNPKRIKSFKEYEEIYGRALTAFTITALKDSDGTHKLDTFTNPGLTLRMNYALRLYFDNGGGPCYICSTGAFDANSANTYNALKAGLDQVGKEDEPTILLFPDAPLMDTGDFYTIYKDALNQCGKRGDRVVLVDLKSGGGSDAFGDIADTFRSNIGTNFLKYGAAYYPYLNTTLNFDYDEAALSVTGGDLPGDAVLQKFPEVAGDPLPDADVPKSVFHSFPNLYYEIKAALDAELVTMPPSAAIAGVYATVDRTRGVWKAPANISLNRVLDLSIDIDDQDQESMNVDPSTGKSVNAIRKFAGKGILVWGARTLAGNDNEWRYVSVRRFFNMVEESVKKATGNFVFEPNDANTWLKVRAMIENFLTLQWRAGALAGAKAEEAFFVRVGLGTTMTADDILNGRMIVEIGMAVVRPAEFIILKFSHKMQTS